MSDIINSEMSVFGNACGLLGQCREPLRFERKQLSLFIFCLSKQFIDQVNTVYDEEVLAINKLTICYRVAGQVRRD